jgi:hypothetical protein
MDLKLQSTILGLSLVSESVYGRQMAGTVKFKIRSRARLVPVTMVGKSRAPVYHGETKCFEKADKIVRYPAWTPTEMLEIGQLPLCCRRKAHIWRKRPTE